MLSRRPSALPELSEGQELNVCSAFSRRVLRTNCQHAEESLPQMFGGLTKAADSYISTLKQVHRRNYRTRCSLQHQDAPLKITLKANAAGRRRSPLFSGSLFDNVARHSLAVMKWSQKNCSLKKKSIKGYKKTWKSSQIRISIFKHYGASAANQYRPILCDLWSGGGPQKTDHLTVQSDAAKPDRSMCYSF